jgi:hypothetical protein
MGTPQCILGNDAGVCIDNSIILNTAADAPADTVTGSACIANYTLVYPQSTALTGAHDKLGVDPMLADPAGGDYHLEAGSPAIDAADPGAIATPDFDRTPRPQGARSDLGAFEYMP